MDNKPVMLKVEEFVAPEFLDVLYKRFEEHLSNCETSYYFREVVITELSVGRRSENIHKILANLGLTCDYDALVHLLETNCYSSHIPAMSRLGHEWTRKEMIYIAGYQMFVNAIQTQTEEKPYPYKRPEQQVKELIENLDDIESHFGPDYIKSISDWTVGNLVDLNNKFHNEQVQFQKDLKEYEKQQKEAKNEGK